MFHVQAKQEMRRCAGEDGPWLVGRMQAGGQEKGPSQVVEGVATCDMNPLEAAVKGFFQGSENPVCRVVRKHIPVPPSPAPRWRGLTFL